jgi:hypothetical protein
VNNVRNMSVVTHLYGDRVSTVREMKVRGILLSAYGGLLQKGRVSENDDICTVAAKSVFFLHLLV